MDKSKNEKNERSRGLFATIDLKSFYASVECVERGLDPLSVNLVVADNSRTDKTICLAVSPTLKAWGVSSRPRLFEVIAAVREINSRRRWSAPGHKFSGASWDDKLLRSDSSYSVDYITATPRMALYVKYSTKIYGIYLKYFASEDIHVYSIDEVFIDIAPYVSLYKMSARELVTKVIYEILDETGITATAGIGTNMYLAKVSMDIVAKRITPDKFGVRIAELDEMSYRRLLWEHRPLTDFFRVGAGYRRRLEQHGLFTMGDIALLSVNNEELLYKLFGVNAELLIDHAWGWESCEMSDIKNYTPRSNSISSGQVLSEPYSFEAAQIIVREMADSLALDILARGVRTNQLTLTVGYEAFGRGVAARSGDVTDRYGRITPPHSHGSVNLGSYTASSRRISDSLCELFNEIASREYSVRRICVCAANVLPESEIGKSDGSQLSFFPDFDLRDDVNKNEERELRMQRAVLTIKNKFGSNSILRGMNYLDGATAIQRNMQIGGHKA